MCSLLDFFVGLSIVDYELKKTCITIPLCLALYATTWICIKYKGHFAVGQSGFIISLPKFILQNFQSFFLTGYNERNKKLFKSLCTYMLMSVLVWALIPFLMAFVYPILDIDTSTLFLLQFAINGCFSESTALMPIILYWMRFYDIQKK